MERLCVYYDSFATYNYSEFYRTLYNFCPTLVKGKPMPLQLLDLCLQSKATEVRKHSDFKY